MSSRGGGSGRGTRKTPNYPDLTREQRAKVQAALGIWEDHLRGLPEGVRELHAFDRLGNHLFGLRAAAAAEDGGAGKFPLTGQHTAQMQDAILMRNHSSGLPFSIGEVQSAFRFGAREIQIVAPSRTFWLRATDPKGEPWTAESFARLVRPAYDRAYRAEMEAQTRAIRGGQLTAERAESPAQKRAFYERVWRSVASEPSRALAFGSKPRQSTEDTSARRVGATQFARRVMAELDRREAKAQARERRESARAARQSPPPPQSAVDRYAQEMLDLMEQQRRSDG